MKTNIYLSALAVVFAFSVHAADVPRQRMLLDDNWRFIVADPANAAAKDFDDASWRTVTLPHDWSIERKIDPKAPMGGGGGFFPAGIGWYRLHLNVPADWQQRRVQAEFEGVYMNAEIYLNGQKLAFHPYGYTSFFVDLTSALRVGADNVLAVRVDNSRQPNSRWYSGSGIYRHVWLDVLNPVHVAPWGVYVIVPKADAATAQVAVRTEVANEASAPKSVTVQTELFSPEGKSVAKLETECQLPAAGEGKLEQQFTIKSPALWSPENPQLSRVVTRLVVDGKTVDETSTTYGVRALAWSVENGLTINGKTYKLNGGCIHHDNGVLGACAFDRAEVRKIELLKAGGFNAIRAAHNPPSPALLNACDRLGMLVLNEAFDCWAVGKKALDYSVVFKDWWQRDIDSMVRRDRNHPSVVMWSIGNEIPGIYDAMGAEYGPKLADRIRSLDKTRPVTNGILGWPVNAKMPRPDDDQRQKNADVNWDSHDIVGSNYAMPRHVAQHDKFPKRILVSTESQPPVGEDHWVADNSYVVGDFVWSAQDYLGEVGVGRWFFEGEPTEPLNPPRDPANPKPNPVAHGTNTLFPWHGANPGDLDLIGNLKPAAHRRNVHWGQEKLALAVRQPEGEKKIIVVPWGWFPTWQSWTWPGMEGKNLTVEIQSRYEKVRLYLNGKVVAEQTSTRKNYDGKIDVAYEPGELKAVGVENGKEIEECKLETVGEPVSIRLTPDRKIIHADGQDLSFVAVEVLDKNGKVQPNASEEIQFECSGPGRIAGLGNANLKSEEPYQGTQCRVFHGRALVVLRSEKQPGVLTLKANAAGLQSTETVVESK